MKTFTLALGIVIILGLGAFWLLAAPPLGSPPTIPTIIAGPTFLTVNAQTAVTFTIALTSPAVIPTGINLLRLNGQGTQPTVLGQLHDDGLNGDIAAGDQIYSLRIPITPSAVGVLPLQVSAAFKGLLQRVTSPIMNLNVYLTAPLLPPDPGAAGNATVAGVDADQDGIRDDVQRYIALTYPTSTKMRVALTGLAAAELAMIRDANDTAVSRADVLQEMYATDCLFWLSGSAKASDALQQIVANTNDRAKAYLQADDQAGQMFFRSNGSTARCLVDPNSIPN